MKKVFLFLILLFPIGVLANDSEKVLVGKEKLYKYYEIKKEYSDYLEEGSIEYSNKTDQYILSDEIVIDDINSFNKTTDVVINEKKEEKYLKLKKIRYIKLSDFESTSSYARIVSLKVLIKEVEIPYTYSALGFNSLESFNKFGNIRSVDGEIIIDLLDYYNIEDIKLFFITEKVVALKQKYKVSFYNDLKLEYIVKEFELDYSTSFLVNNTITITEDMVINYDYEELSDLNVDLEHFSIKKLVSNYYTYQNKLYKYYRDVKVYLDGYFKNKNGYIRDSSKYKIKNIYKTISKEEQEGEIVDEIKDISLVIGNDIDSNSKKDSLDSQKMIIRHVVNIIISLILVLLIVFIYKTSKKRRGDKC